MSQPAPRPESRPAPPATIPLGATVYGQDNARFGQVAGSYREYLIVERGFFMPVDYYVPLRAVRRVEGSIVTLGVTRDAALTQGWEKAPFTAETGPRRPRQPAVSGREPGAQAPASVRSVTPRPGEATGDATGRTPAGWPAPAGPSSPSGQPGASPAAGDPVAATPTAADTSPLFADAYAIGINTDSYQALADHPAPTDAGSATVSGAVSRPADPESIASVPDGPASDQPSSGVGPAESAGGAADRVAVDQPGDIDRPDGDEGGDGASPTRTDTSG